MPDHRNGSTATIDQLEPPDAGAVGVDASNRDMDAKVRAIAARERGEHAPVKVRHIRPAGRPAAAPGASLQDRIVAYLTEHGPASAPQISQALRANAGSVSAAIRTLRENGMIARDGHAPSPAGGRPQVVYCAVTPILRAPDSQARTGDAEAEQPAAAAQPQVLPGPGEASSGDAADARPERSQTGTTTTGAEAAGREAAAPTQPAPVGDTADTAGAPVSVDELTAREQLALRYVRALITQLERASILRDPVPEHVYDRVERLLDLGPSAADALRHTSNATLEEATADA